MSTDGGAEKATEPQFKTGRDTIEYNEYPSFETNLISDAFIQKMVGQFNNEEPESSFDESWTIFGKSKPNPKDNIKYMLGKRHVEGFPTLEIMGFAEFEGVTAAACWETMENHSTRMEWDANMAEFRPIVTCTTPSIGKSGSWHEVCYSKTKFPFPLSARDCVYNKYISLDFEKGIFFCVWRPCTHPDCPKQKKVTRSWSYGAQFMFQMPGNKMRVWQAGTGDPKGHIPAWLINIAMPKIAVAGVRDLRIKTEEVQKKLGPSPQLNPKAKSEQSPSDDGPAPKPIEAEVEQENGTSKEPELPKPE